MERNSKVEGLIDRVAGLMGNSRNIVAFTGAGASTESDIPDFRSNKGSFNSIEKTYGYQPEVLLSYSFFLKHPAVFYDYYKKNMLFLRAMPNNCHKALAKLEKDGRLKAVVTQNIDGLHQAAGSESVLELHGSVSRNYCMDCGRKYSLEELVAIEGEVPRCGSCNGIIRPDVVMYEETLDEGILGKSVSAITKADVLIVIGSSLVVYPAAGLLNYYGGEKLILINRDPTPFDGKADLVINGSAGEILKEVMDRIVS